jgi:hypothetical protein
MTEAQGQHVAKVYPEFRDEMAAHLLSGAEVMIRAQDEVGEAGAFAIEVRGSDFWIDCCSTQEAAENRALRLGLRVCR